MEIYTQFSWLGVFFVGVSFHLRLALHSSETSAITSEPVLRAAPYSDPYS